MTNLTLATIHVPIIAPTCRNAARGLSRWLTPNAVTAITTASDAARSRSRPSSTRHSPSYTNQLTASSATLISTAIQGLMSRTLRSNQYTPAAIGPLMPATITFSYR